MTYLKWTGILYRQMWPICGVRVNSMKSCFVPVVPVASKLLICLAVASANDVSSIKLDERQVSGNFRVRKNKQERLQTYPRILPPLR